MAALRTAIHSCSVFGRIFSSPAVVMIVPTEAQMTSACGSTTASISSLVSTIGLNGGGSAPPLHADETSRAAATIQNVFRILTYIFARAVRTRDDPLLFSVHANTISSRAAAIRGNCVPTPLAIVTDGDRDGGRAVPHHGHLRASDVDVADLVGGAIPERDDRAVRRGGGSRRAAVAERL
jgi:hypothetical protein